MFSGKDETIWLYQNSLKYRPDSWETHYGLAYTYMGRGEIPQAKNELLKAEELNPGNKDFEDLLNKINEKE